MSTEFRLFIFTCNQMALILLRAPIISTVSSFDRSAVSLLCKNAEYQLNGNRGVATGVDIGIYTPPPKKNQPK